MEINLASSWVDITKYVMQRDGVHLSNMGRVDEASGMQSGQLTMTLKNQDARFTPKNAAGAYYPNIIRNTPVRVSVNAQSVTGPAYNGSRFYGQITSWPPTSDISQRDVYVQVTASGIWQQIAQSQVSIGSAYTRYVRQLTGTSVPATSWTMEDGSGSTVFVTQIGAGAAATFTGTPSFAQDGTSFAGTDALPGFNAARIVANVSSGATPTNNVVRFALSVPAAGDSITSTFPGGAELAKILSPSATVKRYTVSLIGNQLVLQGFAATSGGSALFTGVVSTKVNGVPVLVSVEITPSGGSIAWALRIIKPGAGSALDQVTGTQAASTIAAVTQVQLNDQGRMGDSTFGELGVFYAVPSLVTAAAALGGFAGELAVTRFQRLCTEFSIASEVIGSGGAAMGPQVDDTLSNQFQMIEATDGGMLYETTDQFGLGYRTLASMQNQSVAVTLNYAAGQLGAPLAATYDLALVKNQWQVANWDGYTALATLTSGALSIAQVPNGIGPYTGQVTINANTHAQVNAIAQQRLYQGTVDDIRYPQVTTDLRRGSISNLFATVPALRTGDYLQVTNLPAFEGASTAKQLIWGWEETLNAFTWTQVFNTVPEAPYEAAFNPGVFTVVQAPSGPVAGGSQVGASVSGAQLGSGVVGIPELSNVVTARKVGGTTSFIASSPPFDWTFTVTGTPADATYFTCTQDQSVAISAGDTFVNSGGLGGPFTVTSLDPPSGGNVNVHFTPDASGVMSSGTVQGGKNGDLWINTGADNKLEQWQNGAWTPYLFGTGALAGVLSGLFMEGGFFLCGAGGGSTWLTAVPTVPGYFMYWDTGVGNPTLICAISAAAGTDQWGNTYQGGMTLTGLVSLLNVLTVQDTTGNTLAAMDYTGNVIAQLVAAQDVFLGGRSVFDWLNDLASGVVNRGWTQNSAWPATPIGTTETAVLELDQVLSAGRSYKISVIPANFIPTNVASSWYGHTLRATTDGTTPTTSTTSLLGLYHYTPVPVVLSGITCQTPYMEYITPNLGSDTLYRFLVTAFIHAGTFQYTSLLEMRIEDIGPWQAQTNNNNGQQIGTGTSGGSTSVSNYTEDFYPSATHTYSQAGTLLGTNGSMFHGDNGGGSSRYSYITWGTGSLGNSLTTVLNNTVNKVSLRLTNQGTYANNGMTWGLHWSGTLGGGSGTYSTILNSPGAFITRGNTYEYVLGTTMWNPLQTAGRFHVLAADATNLHSTAWYGWFAGGTSVASYTPRLRVQYTV